MTETIATPPRWFTIAAIGAILFELFGVANYLMDALRSPQALAALPIDQQLMWAATPRWESAGVDRILNFMGAHPEGFATLEAAQAAIEAYVLAVKSGSFPAAEHIFS